MGSVMLDVAAVTSLSAGLHPLLLRLHHAVCCQRDVSIRNPLRTLAMAPCCVLSLAIPLTTRCGEQLERVRGHSDGPGLEERWGRFCGQLGEVVERS